MFFLIDYDCREQKLMTFKRYEGSEWEQAQADRLELELALNAQGVSREVVILEADDEAQLRTTHQRYFQTFEDISAALTRALTGTKQSEKAA